MKVKEGRREREREREREGEGERKREGGREKEREGVTDPLMLSLSGNERRWLASSSEKKGGREGAGDRKK